MIEKGKEATATFATTAVYFTKVFDISPS